MSAMQGEGSLDEPSALLTRLRDEMFPRHADERKLAWRETHTGAAIVAAPLAATTVAAARALRDAGRSDSDATIIWVSWDTCPAFHFFRLYVEVCSALLRRRAAYSLEQLSELVAIAAEFNRLPNGTLLSHVERILAGEPAVGALVAALRDRLHLPP